MKNFHINKNNSHKNVGVYVHGGIFMCISMMEYNFEFTLIIMNQSCFTQNNTTQMYVMPVPYA